MAFSKSSFEISYYFLSEDADLLFLKRYGSAEINIAKNMSSTKKNDGAAFL